MFKVLFDTKSFYIYCSKASPFTSIQNLSLFTIPSKMFFNISFFIVLIYCSFLSFKSAISLTFVLYTFVLMYPHRTKSSGVKSGEHGVEEIGPRLPIHFPSNLSSNRV